MQREGSAMAMRTLRWRTVSVVAVFALGAIACSSDGGGVGTTLADYSISLDETSGSAGDVTFDIHNDAEQTHEFVVFKTDLAEDQLPTDDNGDVEETGTGVELVDEAEEIEGGSDTSLSVNLATGSYVVICNLPGHYRQGMHAGFTVS